MKKKGQKDILRAKKRIIKLFLKKPTQKYNYKQISKALDLKSEDYKEIIIQALEKLQSEKRITEEKRGKYKFNISENIYIVTIKIVKDKGEALLDEDKYVDIFPKNLNGALHGDTVKLHVFSRKYRAFQGEVIEIIKEGKREFVGTLDMNKGSAFFIPTNRKLLFTLLIPRHRLNNATEKHRVIVRLLEFPHNSETPLGKVVKIIGNIGDNETEIHSILEEFELPYHFPHKIEQKASKISDKITSKEIKRRRDFRNITTFTIDPEDAKDFDDALSIRTLDNGNTEIGVHIADVTHYIEQDDVIDKEAYKRGTSVYLVDRVIPMLPEILSNTICSLREKVEKLCFSTVFEIDANTNIVDKWIGRTVIYSNRRFTYEQVQKIIEDRKGDYYKEIANLNKIAKTIKQRRLKSGAINFHREDVKIVLDKNANPIDMYQKYPTESNSLIEEFMLLANRLVAETIGKDKGKDKGKNRTFVYRVHDFPNEERINFLSSFIKRFGYSINKRTNKELAQSINDVLDEVKHTPEQNIIEMLSIRSMAKAKYSTKNIGHYGLAFDYYTHFTSPIRRYPDMIVHRLLSIYLKEKKSPKTTIYEEICQYTSKREQIASMAEKTSIRAKQVEYLSKKKGQIFEGIISGIVFTGIFVEIKKNGIGGFVPKRSLKNDQYFFNEKDIKMVGSATRHQYQLGDKVTIKVVETNPINRKISFHLLE